VTAGAVRRIAPAASPRIVPAMPTAAVRRWIALVCWFILAMIVLGGVTRLTQSGLSMVTWEPILGAIPPLDEADWQHRFDQYRAFPEYQKLNKGMSLPEFKRIFYWEYFHRLVGRLIGVVFALPFLWFLFRGRLRGAIGPKLGVAFLLGGLQGFLGWYMVKSGLVDDPRVSHFRLAAHFSLALLLLAWLHWIYLDLAAGPHAFPGPRRIRKAALAFLLLLVVQIVWGAFVAGLDAGLIANTFPRMFGRWVPPQAFDVARAGLADLVNNPVTVQFLHRLLGALLVLAAWGLWWWARNYGLSARQRLHLRLVLALTLLQFALGIVTLLRYVPVALAAGHQLNAALLLLAAVGLLHALRGAPAARG
jgi:cytochrome c oxidase assembly protein subunit 15